MNFEQTTIFDFIEDNKNNKDYEWLLMDRIDKIISLNKQYDLENNAYISFSGGKDSTILHCLIDLAIPNNKIPRVFVNTGIEYNEIVKFVNNLSLNDDRIIIINSNINIKKTLIQEGYPFKSKEFSQIYDRFKRLGKTKSVNRFLSLDGKLACPKKLLYLFEKDVDFNISDKCCDYLKKKPLDLYAKESKKNISLIGITGDDKGRRNNFNNEGCIKNYGKIIKIYPLRVITKEFEEWFIDRFKIKLCKLYYPPYNFQRTGCKGCPFDSTLQKDLDTMQKFFPNEKEQCERIWKPVYEEYRRIGYRLKK